MHYGCNTLEAYSWPND